MRITIYILTVFLLIGLAGMVVMNDARAQSQFNGYVGEAGTTSVPADGTWTTINYERSYDDPVVVGTTNTDNNGNGLIFEARGVQADQAQVRICESQGATADGCDPGATANETVGYLVIDTTAANNSTVDGIEAGSFDIDGEFTSNAETVTYDKSFGTAPYVFTAVQTVSGTPAIETRVSQTSATDFTAGLCEHQTGSSNGCDSGHVTETVGWVAIEPSNIPWNETGEVGLENNIGGSNWTTASFQESYTQAPVLVVENITENGNQESQIDEARNVTTPNGEVRYCEIEDADGSCDGHTGENIAWSAIAAGSLSIGTPSVGSSELSSSNYSVVRSSLNSGGRDQVSSANYQVADTVGEQATGESGSANYQVQAGYRQMAESNIAISSQQDINLGSFGGVDGGAAEATPSMNVITDNEAGYELSVKADTSPAMQNTSAGGSFADYNAGTDPDYTFSVSASESAFGFSPEGANVTQEYLDDGSSCNTGSQQNSGTCWRGFTTSDQLIAQSSDNNQPDGATMTLRLRAESGSNNIQTAGTYEATITVTAVAI